MNDNLLKNAALMAESASKGIGPDIVIVVSPSDEQAAYWQKRLTNDGGLHGSGVAVKKSAIVLSVSESNWKGLAGNALGTLNGFIRAARKAGTLGLIKIHADDNIADLIDEMSSYCGGKSVFMFHTAGRGTRMAPLPAAEVNSKANIKLPRIVTCGGAEKAMTMMEGVIMAANVFAPTRIGRLGVFWGDQMVIGEEDPSFKLEHHIEMFGQHSEINEEIKAYGVLIPAGGMDAKLREKLTLAEIEKLLPGQEKNIYKSIGSFTVSLDFFRYLAKDEKNVKMLAAREGHLNTDPDWWQPLTSEKNEYIEIMISRGIDMGEAADQWGRVNALWEGFTGSEGYARSGLKNKLGLNDLGSKSLWMDYGKNKAYYDGLMLLTEDSPEGDAARKFFCIEKRSSVDKDSSIGGAHIENSVILGSAIGRGSLKNCVVINSEMDSVNAENVLIVDSRIMHLNAVGAICYNVADRDVRLEKGDVLVNIFHPNKGRIVMRTALSRNGADDWKNNLHVMGNEYTYHDLAELMDGVHVHEAEKVKADYILSNL